MSYLSKAKELYQMIESGQMMEAFEKFYHEEIEVIEANGDSRKGKEAQRKGLAEWQASLEAFHGNGHYTITSNEEDGITTVESWADITFKGGNRMKMEEVGVQTWKDGQIIRERFYYNMPGM